MKTTLFGMFLFSALPYVAAHGYLRQIAIAGKIYRGNIPNVSNFSSPIRAIDDVSPVKGATNRAINCGQNAKIAELVADANPGDELTFDWAGGDNGNWPHDTGPILTYLATCGNTTCDKFDAINAKWFKIDEVGQKPNSAKWFQEDIMNGDTYSTHLPENLAPGDYLVRHEIIGLHIANVVGGAEFYPSCTQIRVGGNQTGQPNSTVSLPGAYDDNSQSLVGDFFDPIDYEFPGPAISPELASGGVAITDPAPKTDGQPDPTASATTSSSQATQTADDDDDGDDGCDDDDDEETRSTSATSTAVSSASASASPTATTSANIAVVSSSSDDTGYSYRPRRISRIMRRHYPY